ncbi:MAG: glycosyltransferase family 4 protein [Promethearchaeota archaeon]
MGFKERFLDIIIKLVNRIPPITFFKTDFIKILNKILIMFRTKVLFIVEGANWAIYWVGKDISDNLKKLNLIDIELSSPILPRKKILHFGSINCLINSNGVVRIAKSNKVVLTWFHIDKNDKRIKYIPLLNEKLDLLHTSSEITKNMLIKCGFDKNKIVKIPLGVDLSIFKKYTTERINELKKKYNLPEGKYIIGSFQKDGIGWGEGLEPKLVKGPDILCEVLKKLAKKFDIHIFLTGPSRGYVKKELEKSQISYTHIFLKDFNEIVDCYNVLDLYLITSRAEGGPKALVEGMATGVPIISSNVGMTPDIIKHGINGYIAEIGNVEQIYEYSCELLKNIELKEKFIKNGLEMVKKYDWKNLVKDYYYKIYKNL